jgi:hypothetical protein
MRRLNFERMLVVSNCVSTHVKNEFGFWNLHIVHTQAASNPFSGALKFAIQLTAIRSTGLNPSR